MNPVRNTPSRLAAPLAGRGAGADNSAKLSWSMSPRPEVARKAAEAGQVADPLLAPSLTFSL